MWYWTKFQKDFPKICPWMTCRSLRWTRRLNQRIKQFFVVHCRKWGVTRSEEVPQNNEDVCGSKTVRRSAYTYNKIVVISLGKVTIVTRKAYIRKVSFRKNTRIFFHFFQTILFNNNYWTTISEQCSGGVDIYSFIGNIFFFFFTL